MDKTDVAKDEVNVSSPFISVSDMSSCCELPVHLSSLSGVEGYTKLLKATVMDQGIT